MTLLFNVFCGRSDRQILIPGEQPPLHGIGMKWRLFTRDKDLAVRTAAEHIE